MSAIFNHPSRPYIATAALAAFVRVKIVSGGVVVATADEAGIGVTEAPCAAGAAVSVRLFSSPGSAYMTASAAITSGAVVRATAAGKVDDAAAGPIVGTAMQAATGDGHVIEVLLPGVIGNPVADTITGAADLAALKVALLALLKGANIVANA